jgi:hypothetical protein
MGVKHGLLTIRGEHKLRVFEENRVLRGIFGPKREGGENCITRSFIICTLRQVKLEL